MPENLGDSDMASSCFEKMTDCSEGNGLDEAGSQAGSAPPFLVSHAVVSQAHSRYPASICMLVERLTKHINLPCKKPML